jgi:hypothetical protein
MPKRMLAFVIPFKPKLNSKNWEADSKYLRNTLLSIVHQTTNDFHVFVVIHEMPLKPFTHSKIDYLRLPYQYCEFKQIEDRADALKDSGYLTPRDIEYLFDQGRKQLFGAHYAKEKGFEYIMSIDADDLVCINLVDFVSRNKFQNRIGWFVNKGYYYIENRQVFVRQPYSMNTICGSTHIIHRQALPDVNLGVRRLGENNFFSNHGYLTTLIKSKFGKELQPLPFYAIIYRISNSNWSITTEKMKGTSWYYPLKYLIRKVIFQRSIRRAFYFEKTVRLILESEVDKTGSKEVFKK